MNDKEMRIIQDLEETYCLDALDYSTFSWDVAVTLPPPPPRLKGSSGIAMKAAVEALNKYYAELRVVPCPILQKPLTEMLVEYPRRSDSVCECGADKAGTGLHANWCPKE